MASRARKPWVRVERVSTLQFLKKHSRSLVTRMSQRTVQLVDNVTRVVIIAAAASGPGSSSFSFLWGDLQVQTVQFSAFSAFCGVNNERGPMDRPAVRQMQ